MRALFVRTKVMGGFWPGGKEWEGCGLVGRNGRAVDWCLRTGGLWASGKEREGCGLVRKNGRAVGWWEGTGGL